MMFVIALFGSIGSLGNQPLLIVIRTPVRGALGADTLTIEGNKYGKRATNVRIMLSSCFKPDRYMV